MNKSILFGSMLTLGVSTSGLGQGFTAGSTGMTIKSGTTIVIDSLVLNPTADVTIASTNLTKSSTPVSVNGNASIKKVYNFSTPINYTGSFTVGYSTGILNGNPQADLVLAYDTTSASRYGLNCSTTVDTVNQKLTSSAITGTGIYNLTAVKSTITVGPITGADGINAEGSSGYSDTTSGGTWSSSTAAVATVSSAGTAYGVSGGLDTLSYSVSNGCRTATAIKVVQVYDSVVWNGGTDTSWNTASNWSSGIVPAKGVSATIPSGTTYSPRITTSSQEIKKLTISSGADLRIASGDTLKLYGNLVNNASILNDGSVSMNGTTSQTISGAGKVQNLIVNNASGVSIVSGSSATVRKSLTVASGVLTTNDSLILYSDSTATAYVAPITTSGASVSGMVKVNQYIQGGYRRYRFWSHPFTAATTLSQVGSYIDITGTGGAANGFRTTITNNPSAYRYDPTVGNSYRASDPGWRPFTSAVGGADSNTLKQYQGIRLFFRGAIGEGLLGETYTPSAVTVAQWGNINQGEQVVTLTKGVADSGQDYNMVGNPYPASVDIGTILYNAKAAGHITGSAFYVWNPYMGSGGQFQAIRIGTSSASPYYLQANTAFQVRAAYNGATLDFTENNKAASHSTTLLKHAATDLVFSITDGEGYPYDYWNLSFVPEATSKEDNEDAGKPMGGDFSFYSVSTDNHPLSIDTRHIDEQVVVPLGVKSVHKGTYIIKPAQIPESWNVTPYLHDKYLNQYIQMTKGASYKFDVTEVAGTQGDSRFELVFRQPMAQTDDNTGINVSIAPNPAQEDVTVHFTQNEARAIDYTIVDAAGSIVKTGKHAGTQKGVFIIDMSTLASGVYVIKLDNGSIKTEQKIVKE